MSEIIVPERKLIDRVEIGMAQLGGSPLDFFADPELGRAIPTGNPKLDQLFSMLFNRQDALIREIISLRQRLSDIDGQEIPVPPGVPKPPKPAPAQPEDPFADAVREAASKHKAGAPANGANLHEGDDPEAN